jgi:hypothetical protein
MSFRDTFASRLREVQNQAKDLSSRLPTFDDMAANDAYIHSEEFNVSGQPREYKQTQVLSAIHNQDNVERPEQRQGVTIDSIDEASSTMSSSAAFHASMSTMGSSSAWSLLDRPIPNHRNDTSNDIVNNALPDARKEETTALSNNGNPQDDVVPVETPSKLSNVLLSIVADTLQDTPPAIRSMNHVNSSALPRLSNGNSDNDSDTSHNDDADSYHDEEDPILSMMRNDKGYLNNKTRKIRKKKNRHRFMEDLDRRMEQPNDAVPTTFAALEVETATDQSEQPAPTAYFTRGPFGGAVLNMAMNKFNDIVNHSNSPKSNGGSTPPLARERTPKPTTTPPEEDFHVTNSDSVLSASELEELKNKTLPQGTSLLHLAQFLQEHRHFAFIAFTLTLAVVVYFFTHKNLEDGVT